VVADTEENVTDQEPVMPCQEMRYADPRAVGGLVRTFQSRGGRGKGDGRQVVSAVQSTELSATPQSARRAYRTTTGWYAGCPEDRVQLLDTRAVQGVGDAATLLVLRSWVDPGTTMVVGVARSGEVNTTTFTEASPAIGATELPAPELRAQAALLAAAVNALCGAPGAGTCAGPPDPVEVLPLPTGPAPGMVDVIDLPPVTDVTEPWVGTRPRGARVNAAATQCDRTDFTAGAMSQAQTRTFLVPEADLPDTFGLTQTVGSLPRRAAEAFMTRTRQRMAACEEENLGTEVFRVAHEGGDRTELDAWRLTVEVSDKQAVTYLMGVVRRGGAVSQVGFTPTPRARMEPDDFVALLERARDRLAYL
jgi:hypothetical protein